jgi:hypothetical protein
MKEPPLDQLHPPWPAQCLDRGTGACYDDATEHLVPSAF